MRKILSRTGLGILGIGMLLLATGIVAASPTAPLALHAGSFLNAGGVPVGSVLVLDINLKVTNDEDSGFVGYWALDSYNKKVQVWQVPDGSFYAVVRYEGKWTTFAGALSPEVGALEVSDATGTFQGGYIATFTGAVNPAPAFKTRGSIGSFDFGGTEADILLGSYGAGQTGAVPNFDWVSTYFTGVGSSFTQPEWGWTYHYKSQAWSNFDTGSIGDIIT
jgi:hypothetical protein